MAALDCELDSTRRIAPLICSTDTLWLSAALAIEATSSSTSFALQRISLRLVDTRSLIATPRSLFSMVSSSFTAVSWAA